jgi:hypothetical protein
MDSLTSTSRLTSQIDWICISGSSHCLLASLDKIIIIVYPVEGNNPKEKFAIGTKS